MTLKEYKNLFTEDDAVGWQAIDKKMGEVYTTEPRHYAPPLHYMLGGKDPIDGTSIYDSEKSRPHFHLVSHGMSELYYNEEAVGGEFSKWGFEFTFRLSPCVEDEGKDPIWAVNLMNNLARYVFESGNWFEENQFISAKGPIRLDTDTDIVGLIFTVDPELGKIDTPHGEVTFLQMVGITSSELDRLQANPKREEVAQLIEKLKVENPLLVTDLRRK